MRWFKHMSDASTDEALDQIIDEFGLEGYARYWLILEAIASQMDGSKKCSVTYSWVKWQTFLKGKRNKLETFLERSRNVSLLDFKQTGNKLEIICPKLLKMRDNYSNNLQEEVQEGLQESCNQEVEVEVEVEVEKDLSAPAKPQQLTEFRIPTNRFRTSSEEYTVPEALFTDWVEAYPNVDVSAELRQMRAWSNANPTKRKTLGGMPKFINAWLQRSQNDGKSRPKQSGERNPRSPLSAGVVAASRRAAGQPSFVGTVVSDD